MDKGALSAASHPKESSSSGGAAHVGRRRVDLILKTAIRWPVDPPSNSMINFNPCEAGEEVVVLRLGGGCESFMSLCKQSLVLTIILQQ
jgi:hypothetical protein